VISFARALPIVLLAACGGSDDNDVPIPDDAETDSPVFPDAPPIDGPAADAPLGPDHAYVVTVIDVPENAAQAMQLGLDIDNKPNDGVDNQLGMVFGSLGALAPDLDIQTGTDTSVDRGEIITLILLRGMLDGGGLTLRTFEGTNPMPAACDGPGDTVCRRHLTGAATFDLGTAATTVPVGGVVIADVFRGDGGTVVMPIGLGGTPSWVTLRMAKAELTALGPTSFQGKIGGAISLQDLSTQVIPAIAVSVRGSFDEDCDVGGTPPSCGCVPGTTGETLRGLFDKFPADCVITDAEVESVISGFLTPDIDMNLDGVNDAMSLGLGIRAVPGSFTSPN
jgi:hypothetical protein